MSLMDSSVTAYLGLGGNVGDVLGNMRKALNHLQAHDKVSVTKISKLYKTPPWGIEDQDWFLNACVAMETTFTAENLLDLCLDVELRLNRVRDVRWGPRTIDIDLLNYGNTVLNSERLTLPHPRIAERAFVLVPLGDIAPDFELNDKTCAQMLAEQSDANIETEIDNQAWWPSD